MNRQAFKTLYGLFRKTQRARFVANNTDSCRINRDIAELYRHITGTWDLPTFPIGYDRRKSYTPIRAFSAWLKTVAPRQIPKRVDSFKQMKSIPFLQYQTFSSYPTKTGRWHDVYYRRRHHYPWVFIGTSKDPLRMIFEHMEAKCTDPAE